MLSTTTELVLLVLASAVTGVHTLALTLAILVAVVVCAGLTLTFLITAAFSVRPEDELLLSARWCEGLSVEQYAPMLWLLSDRRLRLLRSRGAVGREIRVRSRRLKVFRRYLKSLRADFKRTCRALKLILILSPKDRPDLLSLLLRVEVRFFWSLVLVLFRLWRYRCGLS